MSGVLLAVLASREGMLLAGRRRLWPDRGAWTVPVGPVAVGESAEQAAVRIVSQAAGVGFELDAGYLLSGPAVVEYGCPEGTGMLLCVAGSVRGREPRWETTEWPLFDLRMLTPDQLERARRAPGLGGMALAMVPALTRFGWLRGDSTSEARVA